MKRAVITRASIPGLALVLAASVGLPACGSSTGPSGLQRRLVQSGSFTLLLGVPAANAAGYSNDVAFVPFSTNASGDLEAIVDWSFSSDDLDLSLFRGACTLQQAVNNQCQLVANTSSTLAKPERLAVGGLPAGNYTLGISNLGDNTESGSYQIFLTN